MSAAQAKAQASCADLQPVLFDVQVLAHALAELVDELVAEDAGSKAVAAASMCRHLGWMAARLVKACGGEAEAADGDGWFLSPAARDILAKVEAGAGPAASAAGDTP